MAVATKPEAGPRGTPGRRAMVALRAVAAVHVVALFAQPVFAGRYLTGDYDALAGHAFGADLVFSLGLVQLAASLVLWWRSGVRWPAAASLVVALGETAQYFAGQAGALDVHVPLGVVLLTVATVALVALFRPLPVGEPEVSGS